MAKEEQLARKLMYVSPNNHLALEALQRKGVSAEEAATFFARTHTPVAARKGIANLGVDASSVKTKVMYTPRHRKIGRAHV